MSERLVGVGHLVGVVFLLHGVAAQLSGVDQLGRQALTHRLLAAVARVGDQPTHGQRDATLGANLDRHLVSGTTDAAALHFQLGLDVVERLAEDLERVFLEARLDDVEGAVDDAFGRRLLAAQHQGVRELRHELVLVLGVRNDLAFWYVAPTGHLRLPLTASDASRRTWSASGCGWLCWCCWGPKRRRRRECRAPRDSEHPASLSRGRRGSTRRCALAGCVPHPGC